MGRPCRARYRFLAELKQRLEAFSLEVHPDKTRIIEFGRFAHENRRARGQGKPGTFAFLRFTHIHGRSREGRRLIRRHTVRERLNAKLLWPVGATPAADGQGSKPDQKSVDRAPPARCRIDAVHRGAGETPLRKGQLERKSTGCWERRVSVVADPS